MRLFASFALLPILCLTSYAIAQPAPRKCNRLEPVDKGYWVNALPDIDPALPKPAPPIPETTCSANITNKSCTIVVDRLRVLTPPTLNVRSDQPVKVTVRDISPFETLTLDWKSAAEVVPPDTFQTAFNGISANIAKITAAGAVSLGIEKRGSPDEEELGKLEDRSGAAIKTFKEDLAAGKAGVELYRKALLAPMADQSGCENDPQHPWFRFDKWKTLTEGNLNQGANAVDVATITETTINVEVFQLLTLLQTKRQQAVKSDDIRKFNNMIKTALALSGSIQDTIAAMSDVKKLIQPRYAALASAIHGLDPPAPAEVKFTISDPSAKNQNFRLVSYTLNYQNKLAPAAKLVAGDISKAIQDDPTGLSTLATLRTCRPSRF